MQKSQQNGKGDRPRNCFSREFREGWERIFRNPLDKKNKKKDTKHDET